MKEKIINTLISAVKFNRNMSSMSNKRVIGEKRDVVTEGDIEIGDFIIKNILEEPIAITIESEEHGKQRNFSNPKKEELYVAIDDIDGSNNLRVGNGVLPYCSMIVVFAGKEENIPYKFSDYKYAACVDYVSERIFYTENGLGRVEQYDLNGKMIGDSNSNCQDNSNLALTLSTDIVSTQRGGNVGYAKSSDSKISVLPSILDGVYKNYAIVDSGCSVFEYAMVGMGIRNGYVSSGKKMHELPLLYAFSKESGKEMCDFEGIPYADREYNFNGKDAEVIAGNSKTIEDIITLIRKQKIANEKIGKILRNSREQQIELEGSEEPIFE